MTTATSPGLPCRHALVDAEHAPADGHEHPAKGASTVEDDSRLIRIEAKVDKLTEAMTTLARVEERQQAANDRMLELDRRQMEHNKDDEKRLKELHDKYSELEARVRSVTLSESTSDARGLWLERAFWVTCTAALGWLSFGAGGGA